MNKVLRSLSSAAAAQLFNQIVQRYKMVFKAKHIQSLPCYWAMVPNNLPMYNTKVRK